ncbi:hypothetical protein K3495_g6382 [Podosphaera aphanis]|nr:hypothetical protein K3495_g6382 [Podosphaera aphanis]
MMTARQHLELDPSTPHEKLEISFDFVVPEKSTYEPGSGPAVPEPTIILDHNIEGFIVSEINMGQGYYTYIVGWEDKPHLLVSVRPQKILDYVSARSYEEWHSRKMDEETRNLITAQPSICNDTVELKQKNKISKKRKRPLVKARKALSRDECISTCPELGNILVPLPTTQTASNSPGDIIRIGSDSEDCSINKFQLDINGTAKNSDSQVTEGGTHTSVVIQNTVDRSANQSKNHRETNARASCHSDNHNLVSFSPGVINGTSPKVIIENSSNLNEVNFRSTESISGPNSVDRRHLTSQLDHKYLRLESRKDSVASISSLEAGTIYDALEMNHKKSMEMENKSIIESHWNMRPPEDTMSSGKTISDVSESESGNQSELEVEDIQDERWEQDKQGNPVVFYLIKWKGNYTDTWEPEENIGSDILSDYAARKKEETRIVDRNHQQSILGSKLLEEDRQALVESHQPKVGYSSSEPNTDKKTRKAKQKAMAINMSEPEILIKKGSGIPGDLGDEDEPFVPFDDSPVKRQKSKNKSHTRNRSKSLSYSKSIR